MLKSISCITIDVFNACGVTTITKQPVGKIRISSSVLEQIKGNIISGEWKPGQKIPGEMELTQMFGVSRVSIRQALHQLAGMGVLDIRQGEGTFVATDIPHQYFDSLLSMIMVTDHDILEVLEMRMIIETESIRLATVRASKKDLADLRGLLENMHATANDLKKYTAYDLEFHLKIAAASQNSLILKLLTLIQDVLSLAIRETNPTLGYKTGVYFHSLTLDAMEARNAEAAAGYMRQQLQAVIDVIRDQRRS